MKTTIHVALSIALTLVILSSVEAGSCAGYTRSSYSYSAPTYSYRNYSHAYAAPVYKDEVVYNKFLAVVPFVVYPSYGAVYAPPPQLPNGNALDPAKQQQAQGELAQILNGLKEVTSTLKDFDARLRALEARQGIAPPAALPKEKAPAPAPKQQSNSNGAKPTFTSVNGQFCASCHQKGNEGHGGDFVLTDTQGKLVPLSDANIGAIQRTLLKGKMPKLNARAKQHGISRQLTAEEAQIILEEVDRQVAGTQ